MIVEFHDHKSTVTSLAAGLGKNVRAIYSAGLDGMLVKAVSLMHNVLTYS